MCYTYRKRTAPTAGRWSVPCALEFYHVSFFFFFFTLVTGPRRSLSLKLSDTRVYEPQIRARLGTTAHIRCSSNHLYFSIIDHDTISVRETVTLQQRE